VLHLPELIHDLGFILIAAAVVSLLFKRFKQPVVLGYLIAGMLVGPHISITPTIVEAESLKIWAEIGVIFLLFGLGLEFSFKKLAQVGVSVSITAVFEVIFMMALGFFAGMMLGWSHMDSLFLGGILSISSTTIIVRALDELGLKNRKFVKLVFGALIVEDIVAVLLLVLLSTVAVTRSFSGLELVYSTLKLMFFVIIWFVLGIYFLPTFLQKVRKYMNSETTLIVAIGLCLLMVIVATKTGFSAALGAFVMGSLLAETRDGRTIEHLLSPVKDLFAAIFFVSVGMLIDPLVIKEHFGLILLLSLITIAGKLISTTLGALISGQNLRHSVQAGMSLAQIGEFSFIIATLGVTLNVTSEMLYPLAVAISAITTFTTPYLIRMSDPFCDWLEKNLPEELRIRLEKYQQRVSNSSSRSTESYLSQYGTKILLNTVIVFALTYFAQRYALMFAAEKLGEGSFSAILVTFGVLTLASPFLWALAMSSKSQIGSESLTSVETFFALLRMIFGAGLVGYIIWRLVPFNELKNIYIFGLFIASFGLMKLARPIYLKMESIFISNLDDKQKSTHSDRPLLAPWDANLSEHVLSPNSELVALTLRECALKEKYGVTIALIERGHKKIIAPSRDEFLFPYDRLFLIGTDEQLAKAQEVIELKVDTSTIEGLEVYGLESFTLSENSFYIDKTIRECGLREKVNGLIVGLERNGKRTLSPDSSIILHAEDLIWIVGDRNKIKSLKFSGT
jgi:monovalent cation:H+ antiporter-2, CPA2 family